MQIRPIRPILRLLRFIQSQIVNPVLKGVNLGNFLIKRVAQELQKEFSSLKTFCTLSPIPSLNAWLNKAPELASTRIKPAALKQLNEALTNLRAKCAGDFSKLIANESEQKLLQRLSAFYLMHTHPTENRNSDPVARFHLNNGARLERVNSTADLSKKGLKQSSGFMVNYLYDLNQIESNHESFVAGEVSIAKSLLASI